MELIGIRLDLHEAGSVESYLRALLGSFYNHHLA